MMVMMMVMPVMVMVVIAVFGSSIFGFPPSQPFRTTKRL